MRPLLRCLCPSSYKLPGDALLCNHAGSEVYAENASREWDGRGYREKWRASQERWQQRSRAQPNKVGFVYGGEFLNRAPPQCNEGFMWHFHGFSAPAESVV